MANKVTDMSKIRKALKMHHAGKSKLFISSYLSLSRNTVKKYISLFLVSGLSIENIGEKTDSELEALFSHQSDESIPPKLQKLQEYFPKMERELKKVNFLSSLVSKLGTDVMLFLTKFTFILT